MSAQFLGRPPAASSIFGFVPVNLAARGRRRNCAFAGRSYSCPMALPWAISLYPSGVRNIFPTEWEQYVAHGAAPWDNGRRPNLPTEWEQPIAHGSAVGLQRTFPSARFWKRAPAANGTQTEPKNEFRRRGRLTKSPPRLSRVRRCSFLRQQPSFLSAQFLGRPPCASTMFRLRPRQPRGAGAPSKLRICGTIVLMSHGAAMGYRLVPLRSVRNHFGRLATMCSIDKAHATFFRSNSRRGGCPLSSGDWKSLARGEREPREERLQRSSD